MTCMYDQNGVVNGYLVALKCEIIDRLSTESLAVYIKKFKVDRQAPVRQGLLTETIESVSPKELSEDNNLPIYIKMEVGEGEETTEVTVQTTVNMADVDPTLLAHVDPNGNKSGDVDLDQDLDFYIEYRLKEDDPNFIDRFKDECFEVLNAK